MTGWQGRQPPRARISLRTTGLWSHLSRFHASLSSKLLGLLGVRMPLTIKATERQSLMDEVNRLPSGNGNLVALLQQMNEDGSTDAARRAPSSTTSRCDRRESLSGWSSATS